MRKKRKITWISLLLCAVLLLGPARPLQVYASLEDDSAPEEASAGSSASTNPEVAKYEQQIDDINKKLDDIEKKNKDLEASIGETRTVIEQEKQAKNALDVEIYNTRSQIDLLRERIELLEQKIELKQEEIEEKQAEHDENYELYLQRLRAMYMYDDATTLGLILGSDDFVDFLTRTEMVVRVAEQDQAMMQNLLEEKQGLERDQAELENDMADVENSKADYESKQNQLVDQEREISSKIQDLDALEAAFKADLANNKAMADAMEAEIKSLIDKIKWSTNPYAGGSMQWPVPNFYSISSGYGWRFGGSDFHTGVDISGSGIYGNSVVAANDGTVVLTNWAYTPGRGYGIYIMLDHGGSIGTLYGHLSNIVVNVGDTVAKGQKIGEVGSTGWSTGPHLHFEVRVNGTYTNPMAYLQG